MERVLVNGQALDAVATTDRGLLYGDGVFETLAVDAGRPCYWSAHMQRLQSACQLLGLGAPDAAQLWREGLSLIGDRQRAVLKIVITRGPGGRGYRAPESPLPTRILQIHEWPDYSDTCQHDGIRTTLCATRLGRNPSLAGIKHLNRLEQVMARREWDDRTISEGLMLDTGGQLVEGTMSNIFLVTAGTLCTPDLTQCGVAGIMRARVLAIAGQERMEYQVQGISVDDLRQADEVFVCNSLIGIWPVCAVDEQAYVRGTVTTRLQVLLQEDAAARTAR